MKDRLNARVKFRESFRPFAASVLLEQAADWFEMPAPASPFMLLVCPVLPHRRRDICEVVHVDGTCRVQTVAESLPGPFRGLLSAFYADTGIPLVLNTSLNMRGMPIAERPEDALDCLYGSRLDRMFIGTTEIDSPDFSQLCPVRVLPGDGARAQSADLGSRMLGLADGATALQEIAGALGLGASAAIDVALGLRKAGSLVWAKVPESPQTHYPLRQYTPAGGT
jgi:carbamoyltransferase